jgi:hypothetical protein
MMIVRLLTVVILATFFYSTVDARRRPRRRAVYTKKKKLSRERRFRQELASAVILESRGKYSLALRHLHRAGRLRPKAAATYCELGQVRFKLAQENQRLRRVKRARYHLKLASRHFHRCKKLTQISRLREMAGEGGRDTRRMLRMVR